VEILFTVALRETGATNNALFTISGQLHNWMCYTVHKHTHTENQDYSCKNFIALNFQTTALYAIMAVCCHR